MGRTIALYWNVWKTLARMGFLMQLSNRWSSLGWLGGKLTRLLFFTIFILAIFRHVKSVGGYNLEEVALFYLTFNVVDIGAQLFLRGLYMIGRDIREGDMDFYLIQPINPLFRSASNLIDFLDFLTLLPVLVMLLVLLQKILAPLPLADMFVRLGVFALMLLNGFAIAVALHVAIAAFTVRTQQLENTIWLYRDLAGLGRFPVDIYPAALRATLMFILPIGLMVTFPAQALLGRLSLVSALGSLAASAALVAIALTLWRWALRSYCSVSS